MKKIAVLFPGIGYHTDKPLLYYSKKLAKNAGYEIREIRYSGFESKGKLRGNPAKMEEAFLAARKDAEKQLDAGELKSADVLFISKSIGTVAACAYAKEHGIGVRQILYTPVEGTFRFIAAPAAENSAISKDNPDTGVPSFCKETVPVSSISEKDAASDSVPSEELTDFIVFHGTADQWVDSPIVLKKCSELHLSLHVYADANHSIETGDVDTDLVNLRDIMKYTKLFIES